MVGSGVRQSSIGNHLLCALSVEEYARLNPSVKQFALGQVVYESGNPLEYVYFPTTSVVSWLYTMQDGSTAEMALAGNDGVVGIASFLGGESAPHRAVVQIGGDGLKKSARRLYAGFARGGGLQQTLLCFTQAPIIKNSQTAAA